MAASIKRAPGMQTVLVTGGAGFIGSALVRQLLRETDATVVNVDCLTYAGNLDSLAEVRDDPRHRHEPVDVADRASIDRVLAAYRPDGIMHLAAESHVDRSIDTPADFIHTNVLGTYTLLEAAFAYWQELDEGGRGRFRFHQVSTDEVFGELGPEGRFDEESPYHPRSPYAASKASADHLARAWHATYGLPVLVSNCSNNYGPYQHPEKLIPLMILNAVAGKPLPVYGDGGHVRDWLYVEDHARALRLIFEQGRIGRTYNVGGDAERDNRAVVLTICELLDELRPAGAPHADLIEHVPDRPGHDRRYAIDATRVREEFGWRPREDFTSGLRRTVEWYLANGDWCAQVRARGYAGERLGLGRTAR